MAKLKLTQAQVTEAIRQAHGMKTGAAELLGVSFPTIERYIAKNKEAQQLIDFWRVRRKDRAEYKLDEAIERGESWAIMFTLKNARDREYNERLDVNVKETQVVEFDYAKLVSRIAPRPTGDSETSGQD